MNLTYITNCFNTTLKYHKTINHSFFYFQQQQQQKKINYYDR